MVQLSPEKYGDVKGHIAHIEREGAGETIGIAFEPLTEAARAALERHVPGS